MQMSVHFISQSTILHANLGTLANENDVLLHMVPHISVFIHAQKQLKLFPFV